MENLNVTLIQTELFWEEPAMNCSAMEQKIWQIKNPTDVIILPEMFSTGFTMKAKQVAESMDGQTVAWMKKIAKEWGALVLGSIVIQENGRYFNRLIWAQPDGVIKTYNKRHLFRMAEEDKIYSSGKSKLIAEWKGWRICPMVCYDLRFPVWSRNGVNNETLDYDLLIYVANWPAVRVGAWDALLKARAIENLSHVVGVNRVGKDGNEIPHNGHSAVIDYKGDYLYQAEEKIIVHSLELNYEQLNSFRRKFPAFKDADKFEIKI